MNNQTYYITYADRSTDQKSIEGRGLNDLFNRLQISDRISLFSDGILPVFHHTSDRQSHIFMDLNYSKYSRARGSRMPVYGVKGKEWKLFRPTHYSQIFFNQEDDMYGAGFNAEVFGKPYLKEAECVDLGREALETRAAEPDREIPFRIAPSSIPFITAVVERIWRILEQDAKMRIVFLLDHPQAAASDLPQDMISQIAGMIRERDKDKGKSEDQILEEATSIVQKCASDHILQERSLALLQQIYLLLPHKLRLQNGFMSCVTGDDLSKIISKGWPIHITTADREDVAQNALRDGVVYIDPVNLRTEEADPQRIALLTKLAENMDESMSSCLSYAEKDVLTEKETDISSFRYFGEIIEKAFDSDTYWWTSEKLETVEDLYARYQDQAVLMQDPHLSKEAMYSFFMKKLPQSGYPAQLLKMLRDQAYPEREKYLAFFGQNLGGASALEAAGTVIRDMETEKTTALETAGEEALQHEAEAVETLRRELTESYESRLAAEQEAHDARVTELEQECSDAQSRIADLKTELESVQSASAQLQIELTQKTELLGQVGNFNVELNRRLEESGTLDKEQLIASYEQRLAEEQSRSLETQDQLRAEMEGVRADLSAAMEAEREAAEKNKSKALQAIEQAKKKASTNLILAIAGFVLAAGGIGGAGYLWNFSKNLQSSNTQLEAGLVTAQSEKDAAEETMQRMSEENDGLQKTVSDLTTQVESESARVKELEAQVAAAETKETEKAAERKETAGVEAAGEEAAGEETADEEVPAGTTIEVNDDGTVGVIFNGEEMPVD